MVGTFGYFSFRSTRLVNDLSQRPLSCAMAYAWKKRIPNRVSFSLIPRQARVQRSRLDRTEYAVGMGTTHTILRRAWISEGLGSGPGSPYRPNSPDFLCHWTSKKDRCYGEFSFRRGVVRGCGPSPDPTMPETHPTIKALWDLGSHGPGRTMARSWGCAHAQSRSGVPKRTLPSLLRPPSAPITVSCRQ